MNLIANAVDVDDNNSIKIETYQRTLFVDVDDTCLDLIGGFVCWLGQMNRLKKVTGLSLKDRTNLGPWLGINDDLSALWTKEFESQSWQWGALRPITNSQQALKAIKRQGWKIVALAHGITDLNRALLRRANLELLFPNIFTDMYTMPAAASFYPYMKDQEDAVCITASIKTALDTAQAGHAAYLYDQPWNREARNLRIKRFPNWIEINNALMKTSPTILTN